MKWSKNPLYARDLQIFANWAMRYPKYRPETWHVDEGSYDYHERSFKVQLCSEFAKMFGAFPPYSVKQLREGAIGLLTLENIDVRSDFAFLHTTEIARLNEWLRHEEDENLWKAFSVLYSAVNDEERLSLFVDTIEDCLERRQSQSRVYPPMLTFWIAYRDPESEVFFKPQSTTAFYQRYGKTAPSPSDGVVKRY